MLGGGGGGGWRLFCWFSHAVAGIHCVCVSRRTAGTVGRFGDHLKLSQVSLTNMPGSQVIKLFILLINVKMPTIVSILTFISKIKEWLW